MNSKTSKLIVDIATVAMLIVAFGLAFFTGFVTNKETGEPMLDMNIFALIAVLGSVILVAVGSVSELMSRVKNNTVTWSFTAFMAVQVVALVGMCAIVIGLLSGAFSTESAWIRGLFLCFVAAMLLGYCQAVVYSNVMESRELPAEDEEESADEEEAESEEDREEESGEAAEAE